jgi:hypothetical protein
MPADVQYIEVPGEPEPVEFPASMTDAQIEAALKQIQQRRTLDNENAAMLKRAEAGASIRKPAVEGLDTPGRLERAFGITGSSPTNTGMAGGNILTSQLATNPRVQSGALGGLMGMLTGGTSTIPSLISSGIGAAATTPKTTGGMAGSTLMNIRLGATPLGKASPAVQGLLQAGGFLGGQAATGNAEDAPGTAQILAAGAAGPAVANKLSGMIFNRKGAEGMYKRALGAQPTMTQKELQELTNTGLAEKIPVSEKGYEMAQSKINAIEEMIQAAVDTEAANGTKIDPMKVAERVSRAYSKFKEQAVARPDLRKVTKTKTEFIKEHSAKAPYSKLKVGESIIIDPETGKGVSGRLVPAGSGYSRVGVDIPIDQAQKMKKGTYRIIGDKYGELSAARTEAQKDLARGLKEEIYAALKKNPDFKDIDFDTLGKREGGLVELLDILNRNVNKERNQIPLRVRDAIMGGALGKAGAVASRLLDTRPALSHMAIFRNQAAPDVPPMLSINAIMSLLSGRGQESK